MQIRPNLSLPKENWKTYRVLADEMSGQESPVGATHNEHICVIHLTAFQNLLRSILLIYKQRLVKVLTNDFPWADKTFLKADKTFLLAETRVIKLAKY